MLLYQALQTHLKVNFVEILFVISLSLNNKNILGGAGRFCKYLMACCLGLGLIQLTSYIALTAFSYITLGQTQEFVLRHIGLVSFKGLPARDVIKYVLPEPVIFLSSLLAFLFLKEISKSRVEVVEKLEISNDNTSRRTTFSAFLFSSEIQERKVRLNFDTILLLIALSATSAVYPCIPSLVYFLVFFGTGTWWACNHELKNWFGRILQCLSIFMILHIIAFLGYQNPWPQKVINEETLIAR